MKMLNIVVLILIISIFSGCATSTIVKDTGKEKGMRFYLPRPYIVVLQEFPVATEQMIVPAYVTPDGFLVKFDSEQKRLLGTMDIETSTTDLEAGGDWLILSPMKQSLVKTSGDDGVGSEVVDGAVAEGVGKAIGNSEDGVAPRMEVDGGTATATVTKGDVSELRETVNNLFDIRYLPDLDERYVLKNKAWLGQASLDAYLTRGWLVHHYGVNVDHSALGKMVFSRIDEALGILMTAGKAAILPANPAEIPGALVDGIQKLEQTSGGDGEIPGLRQIMVKITIAEYAIPGVYPILKNKEFPSIDDNGLNQLKIPGSIQQPANVGLPVAYRTRKDLHVSAVLAFGTEPSTSDSKRSNGKRTELHPIEEIIAQFVIGELIAASIDINEKQMIVNIDKTTDPVSIRVELPPDFMDNHSVTLKKIKSKIEGDSANLIGFTAIEFTFAPRSGWN